jgi:murein DD-endopeptidase MepM/ murein hydrolase activator NlpD
MKKHNKQRVEKEDRKFLVAISDENTHEVLWSINFTSMGFYILIASTLLVISTVVFSLTAFTPLRTFIPGYPDAHSKRAAIQNAIKVDSLENVVYRWELYSENLKNVLTGVEPTRYDSIINIDNSSAPTGEMDAAKDSLLREIVKQEEQFELSATKRNLPIEGLHFFTPLKGVVAQKFDNLLHPYVEITAPENSVVMATLDGTVFYADWSDVSGYMLIIQHDNDIVSIYKHNSKLLKKTGDKVSAGAPIALLGSSDSKAGNLHFELWHKGEAVDPASFINF